MNELGISGTHLAVAIVSRKDTMLTPGREVYLAADGREDTIITPVTAMTRNRIRVSEHLCLRFKAAHSAAEGIVEAQCPEGSTTQEP